MFEKLIVCNGMLLYGVCIFTRARERDCKQTNQRNQNTSTDRINNMIVVTVIVLIIIMMVDNNWTWIRIYIYIYRRFKSAG